MKMTMKKAYIRPAVETMALDTESLLDSGSNTLSFDLGVTPPTADSGEELGAKDNGAGNSLWADDEE